MKSKNLNPLILASEDNEYDDSKNLAVKIVSIIVFLAMALVFGLMPYYIKKCRTSTNFLSISNSFSGGLFLGIGLFHVLPESAETLEYHKLPFASFCAYLSYALILFIEKVAFNSHSFLHKKEENNKGNKELNIEPLKGLNTDNSATIDQINDENLIKNESINNQNEIEEEGGTGAEYQLSPEIKKVEIIPYVLLFALGFHGFFEGMALGIQQEVKDTLFLSLAIAAHKWAASLTLGISVIKSYIKLKQLFIIILIFGLIGPVCIAFGLILRATWNEVIESVFLAISVGTFLYIACTEVLVEEFENNEYKYIKFLMFIIGGIFTAGLSLLEALSGIDS